MKTLSNRVKELSATGNFAKPLFTLIEKDGTIQFINSHLVNILNLTSDNIQGINFFSFLQDSDLQTFKHILSVAKNDRRLIAASFPLKNGKTHYMSWEIMNLASIDKFLCVGYEQLPEMPYLPANAVAPSKTTEAQETATGQIDFRSYIDNTTRFMWITDEKKKIIYSNKSMLLHYNASLENLQEKISSTLSRQILRILDNNNDATIKNNTFNTVIFRSPRADGTERVFKVTNFPIGNNGMTGGEAEDITETWEKEQELRKINERLLYIMQASTEATWEWDIKTGHVLRNIALQDIIGFPLQHTDHVNWWLARIHPGDRDKVEQKIARVLSDQLQSWEEEYRFLNADNKYITFHDKGYVVYEDGVPVKMIGSLQDITEVKKLEHQLMKEKLDKQEKIAEAIIEAQERERNKLGLELHDNVNQVLTTAKLYLEMIKSANERDSLIIEKSRQFIQEAITEIRNVSKAMVLPQLKEDSLVESIRELLEEIRLTGLYEIDFSFKGNTDMEITESKKITLFRIMQEQMKNIIRHSQAKKIMVQLQFRSGDVALIVEDNGVGFDATQKRRGIGLSNIYDRAALYKGTVELKTAVGKGCRLHVTIPV